MCSEVIVVGAGIGGLVAALAAAEAGARVTVLEKTSHPGGSTVLSGGFFALAGTGLQSELGIEDDPRSLEADLLEVGEGANDPALVRAYASGQGLLARWLRDHGVRFEDVELSSGQSVARSHRTDPVSLIGSLSAQARQQGVDVRLGTAVTELHRAGNRVAGVETSEGRMLADAVVLATGGFSRNQDMLERYAPAQLRALRIGGTGCAGDGLRMAQAVGAGARDFEFVKGTFGTHPSTGVDKHEILLSYYQGAIIVNRRGERFVDESISYKLIGDACLAQDEPIAFQIFDQALLDGSPPGVPLFDPRPMQNRGLLHQAESLTELAATLSIPTQALCSTVASYNSIVRGEWADALGRTNLVGNSGALVPIERAPFYAYPSTSVLLATYCGLTIDPDARVLDRAGQVIHGLWAVGELTGGFHGAAYMTGSSLGKSAYFGLVAGRNAACPSTAD